jgi:hypothetical protein
VRRGRPQGRSLPRTYAIGERSSRGIERCCRDDVGFRVITANHAPDHATIARFRVRHEAAIAGLFGGVLALCARSGLVKVGVVAVDGTKIAAAATRETCRRSSSASVRSALPDNRSAPAARNCSRHLREQAVGDVVLAAELGDRLGLAQRREHQLGLLLCRELPVPAVLAHRSSRSLERPNL